MPGAGFRLATRRAGGRLFRGTGRVFRSKPFKYTAAGAGVGGGVYAGGKLAKPGLESLGEGFHEGFKRTVFGRPKKKSAGDSEDPTPAGGLESMFPFVILIGAIGALWLVIKGGGKGRRRRRR